MKHFSLVLFLLFSLSGSLYAQENSSSQSIATSASAALQKGNWLVGAGLGSLGHTFKSGGLSISVYPNAGYFVSNNLAIGTQVQLSARFGKGTNSFDYGLTPFLRYYIPNEEGLRHRWFAQAKAGLFNNDIKDFNNDRIIAYVFGVSGGYAYFLTSNIALEGTLNLDRNTTSLDSENGYTNLSVGFAFQIYLPGKTNR